MVLAPLLAVAGAQGPAWGAALDDAGKERFLAEAPIVHTRNASEGITFSLRATLRLEGFEHDAHIQTIDEQKPSFQLAGGVEFDFRDSYRNNVAAYRLDRLLGLGMIPVTVVRRYHEKTAAYTWWVDDVIMSEEQRYAKKVAPPDTDVWNHQLYVVRVFDQLIHNFDRNLGNLLIDKDWRIWMIDHTGAFKVFGKLRAPENLGPRCERHLLEAMRRLDPQTLRAALKDVLVPAQIDGLLARRDIIVAHYQKEIAEQGEEAVLYDLPARITAATPSR
jgi:hypothetical protein